MNRWTLRLPTLAPHTPNSRSGHWRDRHSHAREWRSTVGWVAKAARVPRVDQAAIALVGAPPDRRRRDTDSLALACKHAIDGLRDAGVLADDDASHVPTVVLQLIAPTGSKRWEWWLVIDATAEGRAPIDISWEVSTAWPG